MRTERLQSRQEGRILWTFWNQVPLHRAHQCRPIDVTFRHLVHASRTAVRRRARSIEDGGGSVRGCWRVCAADDRRALVRGGGLKRGRRVVRATICDGRWRRVGVRRRRRRRRRGRCPAYDRIADFYGLIRY